LNRPFSTSHHIARTCMDECDELLIYYCHSVRAAEECETILIDRLQPKYNKRKLILDTAREISDQMGMTERSAYLYTQSLIEASALES
jgi:hypothetical protein